MSRSGALPIRLTISWNCTNLHPILVASQRVYLHHLSTVDGNPQFEIRQGIRAADNLKALLEILAEML
jgi:hypothetical protein